VLFFFPLSSTPDTELNWIWQCFLYVHHNFATNSPHAMLEICLTSVFNLKGKYQKILYCLQVDGCDFLFFSFLFFFPFCKMICSHFQHPLLADGISMRKSRYLWSRLFTVQLSTLLPLCFLCVRKCTNSLQIQQYPWVLLILQFSLPLHIVILHIAYRLLASQDCQNHLGATLLWVIWALVPLELQRTSFVPPVFSVHFHTWCWN